MLTAADLPDLATGIAGAPRDQPPLARCKVRYMGEPVAAVAAVDHETARAAVELIQVEYEALPAGFDPEAALMASTPVVPESLEGRVTAQSMRGHPTLSVVLDSLSAHKSGRVRQLIEARGSQLWYLPPYSPDLSPIEHAFSKLKTLLRRAQARTLKALEGAIAQALEAVTAADAQGWFAHCGYRV